MNVMYYVLIWHIQVLYCVLFHSNVFIVLQCILENVDPKMSLIVGQVAAVSLVCWQCIVALWLTLKLRHTAGAVESLHPSYFRAKTNTSTGLTWRISDDPLKTVTFKMTILPKKKTPGPKSETETGSEHGHAQVGRDQPISVLCWDQRLKGSQ